MCFSGTRRQLLTAAGCGAALLAATPVRAQVSSTFCSSTNGGLPPYCAWNAAAPEQFQIFSTSGRDDIDRALIAELRRMLAIFPIDPGFKYINDIQPNAFAAQESRVSGTSGTVYIGLNLINSEFRRSNSGGVAVAGICAHECGHIYQYATGWISRLSSNTARLVELHADFLAGFYFGRDGARSNDSITSFADSLFSRGDYNFNDPSHHGTPNQRVSAMRAGYSVGLTNVSITTAAERGAEVVRSL